MKENKTNMRVGILLGPNGRGGMERQANILAKGLIERGILTRVFFNSRPSMSKKGMDWSSIPYQYLWRYEPFKKISQFYLGWLLRFHRIDILHVFFWGNMEFAIGAMKWAPKVVFIGSQRDTDFVTNSDIKKRLTRLCFSYENLTCNAGITRDLMNDMDICPSHKVTVINNGIIVPEKDSSAPKNFKKNFKTILFPNRLFSYKNPILFLEACAEVNKRMKNIRVIICGSGDLEDKIKERIKQLRIDKSCDFRGSVLPEQIPYDEADLVVNCSSSLEGMSNSLMEALSHGVPVVGTKVGGNPELLKDFNFARLVPINDKVALIDAMIELLSVSSEERETYMNEAREYIQKSFSVDRFVENHISYYKNFLS